MAFLDLALFLSSETSFVEMCLCLLCFLHFLKVAQDNSLGGAAVFPSKGQ